MSGRWPRAGVAALALVALAAGRCAPEAEAPPQAAPQSRVDRFLESSPGSDRRAVEIAAAVLERLGGEQAWNETRFVRWRFFGRRLWVWDKQTGDARVLAPAHEAEPERLVLLNVETRHGRAWDAGQPIRDEAQLREALDLAHEWFINDSYWMFMPYKMLDPGVELSWVEHGATEAGQGADVVEMTFGQNVGYTPDNRYRVWVGVESRLVEQWSFYEKASDGEPAFVLPWKDWRRFGEIWLATDHGRGPNWEIAVYRDVPREVFEDPAAEPPAPPAAGA